ncbi:dTDP-4-dehydrorhamnose reductase [Eoetvoesiella caeni]
MKVLLIGGTGQLGRCLQDRRPEGWDLLAPGSGDLNICDQGAVQTYVGRIQPQLIINAAAYNAVDEAERNPAAATALNADGPRHLAQAAQKAGARLVHISTDYVFDGAASQPYSEDAPTNPINAYGKSKRAGELAVLQSLPQTIVLRTSWLYSEYGANFVKTMLRLAAAGKPIRVVNDQVGAPTYAGDLAQTIIQLIRNSDAPGGIYHYTGATVLSWYGFAQHIFQAAGLAPELIPITSDEYFAAAAATAADTTAKAAASAATLNSALAIATRPSSAVLSCEKVAQYGVQPQPLQASLGWVVKKILNFPACA